MHIPYKLLTLLNDEVKALAHFCHGLKAIETISSFKMRERFKGFERKRKFQREVTWTKEFLRMHVYTVYPLVIPMKIGSGLSKQMNHSRVPHTSYAMFAKAHTF